MYFRRKKTRPVRAGVVGVGQMGRYHVGVLAEIPQVELVGLSTLIPSGFSLWRRPTTPVVSRITAIFLARSMWSVSRCPRRSITKSPVNSLTLACMCSSRNQLRPRWRKLGY